MKVITLLVLVVIIAGCEESYQAPVYYPYPAFNYPLWNYPDYQKQQWDSIQRQHEIDDMLWEYQHGVPYPFSEPIIVPKVDIPSFNEHMEPYLW